MALPIDYHVTPSADLNTVVVSMTIPCEGETVDIAMPAWSPGYYILENNADAIKNVSATAADGLPRAVSKPRPDTWHIDTLGAKSVVVSYSRAISHETGRMGIFSSDPDTIHYGGPSMYMYVVGRKETKCNLSFALSKDQQLAVSLEPRPEGGFEAPNYDVLADSPVTLGKFRTASYVSRGKEHTLAIRGTARDRLNLDRTLKMTKFITESATHFFGSAAPYKRYVWHIWAGDLGDGAGGLEHASSSQDFLSLVQGPASMRGLSHEYFHLWNVKRIRSESLGPFDYTRLPRTGSLWWLEGVTDYYASLIPHRYGWYGEAEYLDDLSDQVSSVRSNPKRLEVSPFEGAFRVADAADGRGNSNGFGVNYYPTGWLLGLLFDVEIRARTGGKRSLDDVELALWNMCKDDRPGFAESELRRQIVRFGGVDMGPIFDKWVMTPGELPVEDVLRQVGLDVKTEGKKVVVTEAKSASAAQVKLREGWYWGKLKRPSRLVDGS